jgi:hypothetical protein
MPEFLSNLFQYRSDYIWCNNKMEDDIFFAISSVLTKLPGIYILPYFTICFHEKLIKSLKRILFLFFYCAFSKKKRKIAWKKSWKFILQLKQNPTLHSYVFTKNELNLLKSVFLFICWVSVFREYNMIVRKIRENLFLTKISGKPYHMFSRKSISCSFAVCFFFVKTIWFKNLF